MFPHVKVNEFDQGIPQSHTEDRPMAYTKVSEYGSNVFIAKSASRFDSL